MDEISSLESLSPRELRGSRQIAPVNDADSYIVYAANHLCKACQKQRLSIYHGFDVCMSCIVNAAKTFNSRIETFTAIMSIQFAHIRWQVWRRLKIRKRKPVRNG